MKVLLVVDNLAKDSGVSSIIMNLYRNIENVEFDFLVFNYRENSYEEEIKIRGSHVFYVDNPLSFKTILTSMKQLKLFFKEKASDYDAIHLNSPTTNEFTLRYAKKYGIRNRIIHSHSSMTSPNPIKKILNNILTINVCRYANRFWSCSDNATKFLYGEKLDKSVKLVYNAIEPLKYRFNDKVRDEEREELGLTGKCVFVHVSNFSRIKNLYFLLPVIEETVKLNNGIIYLFVGDGPTRKMFEEMLQENGILGNCKFLGRKTDVQRYLNVADAFLLPSLKEGLPVSVIEAQANGLRCFVSDTITRECDLGNVVYLPLDSSIWTNELLNFCPVDIHIRNQKSKAFEETNFNIFKEAKRVEKLYLSMGDNNE